LNLREGILDRPEFFSFLNVGRGRGFNSLFVEFEKEVGHSGRMGAISSFVEIEKIRGHYCFLSGCCFGTQ
jgi:hypothetical protein